MFPALGALTSLTGGGALTPSSSASGRADGGTFDGGGANNTGDFIVGSGASKSTGLNSKTLLIVGGLAAVVIVVWLARRK
jgi:hypothetical protein